MLTRKRRTPDPLAAMAAANPTSAAELEIGIDDADLERAMVRAATLGRERALAQAVAIGRAATQSAHGPGPLGDATRKPSRAGLGNGRAWLPRTTLGFGIGLGGVVVLTALLLFGGWLGGRAGSRPEFAAAAVRVAEANPRLLVTEPGWKIIRADEFEPDNGELTFSDGSHELEIHWYSARLYESYLHDRTQVSAAEHGVLLGMQATTVSYGRDEYSTILSPEGSVFIEVRGDLGSRRAYGEIIDSLRAVDIKTWLSAMPPSTVRPDARAGAVEKMLNGIPLPPGFDPSALQSENSIADESSLAIKVGDAVACGWAESWLAATAASDQAAASRAVEALAHWKEWPIVRETRLPWFSNYSVVVDQMRAGHLDTGPAGYDVQEPDRTYAVGPAWKLALGCGDYYHREVRGVPGEASSP